MEKDALTQAAEKAAQVPPSQTTQVQTVQKQKPAQYVISQIMKREREIAKALPRDWDVKRFSRIACTAISSNPKLAEACMKSPQTFLGAMMNSAQLGLEPNTTLGQAYILPYNNTDKNTGEKIMQVQFQIGVYGHIALAYRSGEVTMIDAQARHERDFFEMEYGLEPKLKHIPYDGKEGRGEIVGYYGIFKTKNGAFGFKYMTYEEVLTHAKRFSKSYNRQKGKFFGPWETDFDAMAKKTVLIQALKYAPKSSEDSRWAQAFASDNTVRNIDAPDEPIERTDTIDVSAESVSDA